MWKHTMVEHLCWLDHVGLNCHVHPSCTFLDWSMHCMYCFLCLLNINVFGNWCMWLITNIQKITFVIGVCPHVKHVHHQGHPRKLLETFGKPNDLKTTTWFNLFNSWFGIGGQINTHLLWKKSRDTLHMSKNLSLY